MVFTLSLLPRFSICHKDIKRCPKSTHRHTSRSTASLLHLQPVRVSTLQLAKDSVKWQASPRLGASNTEKPHFQSASVLPASAHPFDSPSSLQGCPKPRSGAKAGLPGCRSGWAAWPGPYPQRVRVSLLSVPGAGAGCSAA